MQMQCLVKPPTGKTHQPDCFTGSERYELDEENPMIGFRGCGVYTDPSVEECFAKEGGTHEDCAGRDGLEESEAHDPVCAHSGHGAPDTNELLEPNGLKHSKDGPKVHLMAELRQQHDRGRGVPLLTLLR